MYECMSVCMSTGMYELYVYGLYVHPYRRRRLDLDLKTNKYWKLIIIKVNKVNIKVKLHFVMRSWDLTSASSVWLAGLDEIGIVWFV